MSIPSLPAKPTLEDVTTALSHGIVLGMVSRTQVGARRLSLEEAATSARRYAEATHKSAHGWLSEAHEIGGTPDRRDQRAALASVIAGGLVSGQVAARVQPDTALREAGLLRAKVFKGVGGLQDGPAPEMAAHLMAGYIQGQISQGVPLATALNEGLSKSTEISAAAAGLMGQSPADEALARGGCPIAGTLLAGHIARGKRLPDALVEIKSHRAQIFAVAQVASPEATATPAALPEFPALGGVSARRASLSIQGPFDQHPGLPARAAGPR